MDRFCSSVEAAAESGIGMPERALVELLQGKGAHVSPVDCVEDLSAELAARQASGIPYSIGQIVFHMNYWMNYELSRIRGERPEYPKHASASWAEPPSPRDSDDWDLLLGSFSRLLEECKKLAQSTPAELQRPIEPVQPGETKLAGSLSAVLWQMVAHNSYHTGQIALIRRAYGAWPPPAGGDTW